MTGPRGTPPSLDLAAIQASLAGAEYTWGRDHELLVTIRALLAHARALRAALDDICNRAWEIEPIDTRAVGEAIERAAAVLAQATE